MPDTIKSQYFATPQEMDEALHTATLVPGLKVAAETAKTDAETARAGSEAAAAEAAKYVTVVSATQPTAGMWLEVLG
jgi:hypothetical protein